MRFPSSLAPFLMQYVGRVWISPSPKTRSGTQGSCAQVYISGMITLAFTCTLLHTLEHTSGLSQAAFPESPELALKGEWTTSLPAGRCCPVTLTVLSWILTLSSCLGPVTGVGLKAKEQDARVGLSQAASKGPSVIISSVT